MVIASLGRQTGRACMMGCAGLVALLALEAHPLGQLHLGAQTTKGEAKQKLKAADQKIDPKTIIESKAKSQTKVDSGIDQVALIDNHLGMKWKENSIEPSQRCTDHEFIRRASLDIIGRIATTGEINEFLKWPADKRRGLLVEKLVNSPEYGGNFATLFTNLLMTRTSAKLHRQQMHSWLEEEFNKDDANWSKITTSLLTATGRTNGDGDSPAVNFVLAHLGERMAGNPAVNGQWDVVPVTSRITRLFLGLRTQCAQCHDHPFNDEWRQEHFWGINAYLRQVEAPSGRPGLIKDKKSAPEKQFDLRDNPAFNQKGLVSYERRSGLVEYTRAFFLDGVKMPAKLEGSRRQELAQRVTTSPFFAKAFVNRMWGHFFGRGFTREVDDFGEHSPISHPELLDKLAQVWGNDHLHNPRQLVRWICNSQAYSLGSQANPSNFKPEAEPFFGRMLLKVMTPEQLFESLMTATGAQQSQGPDKTRALRDTWMSKLVVNFGDDEGNEGTFNGTIVQALLMMNGKEINDAVLDRKGGTVTAVFRNVPAFKGPVPRATQEAVLKELYLAGLNRLPTAQQLKRHLDPERMKLAGPAQIDYTFFRAYCEDFYWALLNSNEFILNH